MQIQSLLLLCGVVAGPLFVIVFLVEGALRNGYDPMRQPVSSLSIGKRGWVQKTNFIVTGVLMFACAIGFSTALGAYGGSWWGPFLTGVYALGLIVAGIFTTDMTGARLTEGEPPKRTVEGLIHDLSSLFVFIPLFVDFIVFHHLFAAAGEYGWAIYSGTSAVFFGIGFILFARGFGGRGKLPRMAGLFQRITIAIGWIWVALVAAHLLGR